MNERVMRWTFKSAAASLTFEVGIGVTMTMIVLSSETVLTKSAMFPDVKAACELELGESGLSVPVVSGG